MKKILKTILFIILAIMVLIVLLKCLSNEDDWICRDGQWIKHGVPSVPMPTKPCGESTKVKVFFNNNQLDPEITCEKVFPVEREVSKKQDIIAALGELLKGPTDSEKEKGYITNINNNVRINNLSIENGTARVDFDEQLEYQIGGSCRVLAIRSQIIETLKQFSTIDNVVISINGRTEDILQP